MAFSRTLTTLSLAILGFLGSSSDASAQNIEFSASEINGMLYIESGVSGAEETFIVTQSNNRIRIDHSLSVDPLIFVATRIESIHFLGDDDRDDFYNYTELPSDQYGAGGDDRLNGGAAEDYLDGGDGVDYLYGGGSDDTLDPGLRPEEGAAVGDSGRDTVKVTTYGIVGIPGRYYYEFQQRFSGNPGLDAEIIDDDFQPITWNDFLLLLK